MPAARATTRSMRRCRPPTRRSRPPRTHAFPLAWLRPAEKVGEVCSYALIVRSIWECAGSLTLLIDALALAKFFKCIVLRRKTQAFLAAESEKAAPHQRVLEQPQRAVLQAAIKIDQNIAARYEMRFEKHFIGRQAVVREHHALFQRAGETRAAIRRVIVIGQRA